MGRQLFDLSAALALLLCKTDRRQFPGGWGLAFLAGPVGGLGKKLVHMTLSGTDLSASTACLRFRYGFIYTSKLQRSQCRITESKFFPIQPSVSFVSFQATVAEMARHENRSIQVGCSITAQPIFIFQSF